MQGPPSSLRKSHVQVALQKLKAMGKKHLRTLEGYFTSASTCSSLTMLLPVSSSSIEIGGTESSLVMSLLLASKFPVPVSLFNDVATSSTEKYQHIQNFKNE